MQETGSNRPPSSEAEAAAPAERVALSSLGLRVSERRLLLLLVDVLLVNAALIGALIIWYDFNATVGNVVNAGKWFVTLTAVWLLFAIVFDCYDLARAATVMSASESCVPAAAATVLAYTFVPWLTPGLGSRGFIATFAAFTVAGIVAWRAAYARLFVQPWFEQRALVVGAGDAGRALARALREAPDEPANPFRGTGYRLLGYVDDNPSLAGAKVEGIPVLGTRDDLVYLAHALQVDEVILAITHRHAIHQQLLDALLRCQELGYRVTNMSILYERLLGRVPVDHVGRDLHMVMRMDETAGDRLYRMLKRGVDYVLASMGLVVLGLMVPPIALVNAITSPGPLLYRQRRVGRGGRTFQMLKFRSMAPDAERDYGAVWASRTDQRVTPAGRFLRRTRLDELPQVINVLRGEMSVIGPRPERPEFVELLAEELPFYRARHTMRPGITGWAQIQLAYADSVEDARAKLECDLYYIKHASPLLDARILLQTVPEMLRWKGY